MRQSIKELIKMLNSISKGIIKSIIDNLERNHHAYQQEKYRQQKQILDSRIFECMCQLKSELYEVLSKNSYSRFTITYPNQIRIRNYRYNKGTLSYLFSLPLNKDNSSHTFISSCGLDNIRNQISRDIEEFRYEQKLRYVAPAQYYPFITAGIHIINIKQIGDELFMEVISDINPL